jgi:hypothetical protein
VTEIQQTPKQPNQWWRAHPTEEQQSATNDRDNDVNHTGLPSPITPGNRSTSIRFFLPKNNRLTASRGSWQQDTGKNRAAQQQQQSGDERLGDRR